MNMKNLMMWGLIGLLVVGLFHLFQNPKKNIVAKDFFNLHGFQEIDESRREYVELFNGNSFVNQEGLYIANLKDSNVPFLEIYDDC